MKEKFVQVIKSNKSNNPMKKIRVGAYCRVSSDSSDQVNSFLAQMKYYEDYINSNPNMCFVDIYADEGITGTVIKKRDEFKRLLKDCASHKLDRVLVKSVTRFARNSLECIEAIRLMKENGVSVYFENDNIDSETMNSEMILYIKSAFAQGEAVSAAKRMRTSVRMRMSDGTYKSATTTYGYKFDGKKFIIKPKEAKIVKIIFNLYLSGMGYGNITKYLNENKLDNSINWTIGRVRQMIGNERYIGDCLFGKYYTPDIFPFSKRKNNGQSDKYYYTNTHEAIIDKNVFEKAQILRKSKKVKFVSNKVNNNYLEGKIICKHCGWAYKELYRGDQLFWRCAKKGEISDDCHAPTISDTDIKMSFVKLCNILKQNMSYILDETIHQIENTKVRLNRENSGLLSINERISELNQKKSLYINLFTAGVLDEKTYQENCNDIKAEMLELKTKKDDLLNKNDDDHSVTDIRELRSALEKTEERIVEFDYELFDEIVLCINVEQDGSLVYKMKCGFEFKIIA